MEQSARIVALAERAAAEVNHGSTVGLGSGSTAEAVVRALGKRVASGLHVTGVSTSTRTSNLAREMGIELIDLDGVESLDLGIDGADEIDPRLHLVKGRGGALLWEKLVARLCTDYVIVASSEKLVQQLGSRMPLPVEIVPAGWRYTARSVTQLGCQPRLRVSSDGSPFRTDSGNLLIDCETGPIMNPESLAIALKKITGVVDHGLFIDLATRALTIDESGAITEHRRPELASEP